MLNIILTEEQTKDLAGVKISNLDNTGYVIKDDNKLELPTEVGAHVVVEILDSVDIEKDSIILVTSSGEESVISTVPLYPSEEVEINTTN